MQMNPPQQQQGQQQAAVRPLSDAMKTACRNGHVATIRRLLNEGEGLECVNSNGLTAVMFALRHGQVAAASELMSRGADLSRVSNSGSNMLHFAACGNLDCVDLVLSKTMIDVNSTTNDGSTPVALSLRHDRLDSAFSLVERGANLFKKDNYGTRAIDKGTIGPQVLQHAKDLRWLSVRPILLLPLACSLAVKSPPTAANLPQRRSARLSVLGNKDIARIISTFFLRTEIIVRDPSIPLPGSESDAANRRVEEWLASSSSSSGSNKKARK
jgi:hypothetical protein